MRNRGKRKGWRCLATLLLVVCLVTGVEPGAAVSRAAEKNDTYGVLLAGAGKSYTFYDLNGGVGDQRIEISDSGVVMVPLRQLCALMPDIDYSYDFAAGQAVLSNKKNKKRLVLTENSKTALYYAKGTGRASKKTMKEKLYLSKDSNAAMACKDVLKWVMGDGGYRYYSKKAIKKAGYDGAYKGILVYSPYGKIKALPRAVKVKSVPIRTVSNIVKVTIPEGYALPQIFSLLTKKGVCISTEALRKAEQDMDISAWPLAAAGAAAAQNRCYRLEGYLSANTYEFYKNSDPKEVLGRLLSDTETKWKNGPADQAEAAGMTADEVLTLASIVEKEAADPEEMKRVASVFKNRLETGMRLQSDTTIYYVERYIKPYLSGDKDRFNAFYNTYKCPSLPAGPVCSPGMAAVRAVLAPADTPYLYFFTDKAGNYYYAETYEEHLENQKKAEGI